jgi:O-antigen/teichoic acid export membrane protein
VSGRLRIAQNILALGIGQLFTWVGSAVLVWLLPHYLSSDDFGRYGVAFTLISFIGPFADLGASTHLLRETAGSSRATAKAWLADSLALRVPLISASSAVGVLVMYAIVDDMEARLLFLVFLPSLICFTLSSCISATLRGMQDMAPCALSDVLGRTTAVVLTVLLLMNGFGMVGVALAVDAGALLSLLVLVVALLKKVGLPGPLAPERWRLVLASGFPFFVSGAAVAFHGRVDMLILSHMSNLTVTGWYNVAYSIVVIPIFIPSIIVGAFYPALSQAARNDLAAMARLTRRCLQLVLLGTLPLAFGTSLLAGHVLRVLSYGPEFNGAAPLISILAFHVPVIAVNMVIATAIFALGGEKRFMLVMLLATVLDIALNLALVPLAQHAWDNGAIASASVTLATEVLILPLGLRLLQRDILGRQAFMESGLCILAAEVMALAVLPVRDQFIAVPVLVGGGVYCIAVFSLGIIHLRDLRAIPRYLHDRSMRKAVQQPAEVPAGVTAGT